MTEWVCVQGGTLLVPSGAVNHLHIILNEPKDFDGILNSCVLVNVSTIRNGPHDDTCILEPGCHPFIKEKSYIAYKYARIERHEDLIVKVSTKYFIPYDPVDEKILLKIQSGLFRSPFTGRYLKRLRFD